VAASMTYGCIFRFPRWSTAAESGAGSLAPIFFGLALDCRRGRVLDLHPAVDPA
jgi:hypothetical protein